MSKNIDEQYIDLIKDILENGVKKEDRTGTGTLSVFGRQIRHSFKDGRFPLLTTKRIPFKLVVTELLWFLRGDTNIKFLVDNDCHIWDGDAYKNYRSRSKDIDLPENLYNKLIDDLNKDAMFPIDNPSRMLTKEEFINKIKTDNEFAKKWGDLGPIYGKQWRSWNKWENTFGKGYAQGIDQIKNIINLLKKDPDSRRIIVSAWNVSEIESSVLPPCHNFFQFYTRELSIDERIDLALNRGYDIIDLDISNSKNPLCDYSIPTRAISLIFNMRSTDVPLGLPFNIASYGLLLGIIGKMVNMVPEELIGNLGDTHIYSNQLEGCLEQIGQPIFEESPTLYPNGPMNEGIKKQIMVGHTREPYPLPKLVFGKTDKFFEDLGNDLSLLSHLDSSDFKMENYQSHPTIKFPLSN